MSLTAGTRAEQAAVIGFISKGIGLGVSIASGGIKWGGLALAKQFSQAVTEAAAPYQNKSAENKIETPPPAATATATPPAKTASFDQGV